jgi:hypothetical protein
MKARLSILVIGLLALAVSARAEIQTTRTPGSPSATTTTGGKQLPLPDPKFGGVIKEKATDSKPWWAPRSLARKLNRALSPAHPRRGNTSAGRQEAKFYA